MIFYQSQLVLDFAPLIRVLNCNPNRGGPFKFDFHLFFRLQILRGFS